MKIMHVHTVQIDTESQVSHKAHLTISYICPLTPSTASLLLQSQLGEGLEDSSHTKQEHTYKTAKYTVAASSLISLFPFVSPNCWLLPTSSVPHLLFPLPPQKTVKK